MYKFSDQKYSGFNVGDGHGGAFYTNSILNGSTKIEATSRIYFQGGDNGSPDVVPFGDRKLCSFYSPETIFQHTWETKHKLATVNYTHLQPIAEIECKIVYTFKKNVYASLKGIFNVLDERGSNGQVTFFCFYNKINKTASIKTDLILINKSGYTQYDNAEGVGKTLESILDNPGAFSATERLSNYDEVNFLLLYLNKKLEKKVFTGTTGSEYDVHIKLSGNRKVHVGPDLIRDAVHLHSTDTINIYDGISERYLYNLINTTTSQYGAITNTEYILVNEVLDATQSTIDCFNGDTFITKFAYRTSRKIKTKSKPGASGSGSAGNSTYYSNVFSNRSLYGMEFRQISYYFVESTINCEYRHVINDGVTYYPKTDKSDIFNIASVNGRSNYYNFLYSKENTFKKYVTGSLYPELVKKFPTRTIYSSKSLEGESIDSYKVFDPNDFYDLPKNTGPINNTFILGDIFYSHTSKSLWRNFVNEAALIQATSGDNLVIGQGALFSPDSKEILTIEGGYAGTQSQWAGINTPYGRFFVDVNQNKIFQFSGELKEISSEGLWKFFNGNLKIKDSEVKTPNSLLFNSKDNPANPDEGGYLAGFDYSNKRLIIVKRVKDAKFTSLSLKFPINHVNGILSAIVGNTKIQVTVTKDHFLSIGSIVIITGTNLHDGMYAVEKIEGARIFIINTSFLGTEQGVTTGVVSVIVNDKGINKFDNGFTFSYSPISKSWIGPHTWIPTNIISKADRFFSFHNDEVIGDGKLWEHGLGNYGKFYTNAVESSELVFVINEAADITKVLDNLILHTQCFKESDEVYQLFETFDKIQVYNEYQNTGMVDLVLKKNLRLIEDKFAISIPRDKVIDITKNIFDSPNLSLDGKFQKRIRSKYTYIKLIYLNTNNNRLVLNAISSNFRISHR